MSSKICSSTILSIIFFIGMACESPDADTDTGTDTDSDTDTDTVPPPDDVFYIWEGATGDNSGTGWNNAFTTFPTTMVRNAVYYVASGAYGRVVLNTVEQDEQVIWIRKATDEDHGPSSEGWVDDSEQMGIGQAIFGQVRFESDWWVFDGSVGGGPHDPFGNLQPHGFFLVEDPVVSQIDGVLFFGTLGTVSGSNIDVLHTEVRFTHMDHPAGSEDEGAGGRLVLMQADADDPIHHLHFSYCWFHTVYASMLKSIRTHHITIEYSAMSENRAESTGNHASIASLRCSREWEVRWNYFRNVGGSGIVNVYEMDDCNLDGDLDLGEYRGREIRVHGNVWYEDNTTMGDDKTLLNEPFDTGTLNGFNAENPGENRPVVDSLALNNTIVGLRGGTYGKNGSAGRFHQEHSTTKVWNNLFYDVDKVTNKAGEVDYNLYFEIDYITGAGPNAVELSGDYNPFVDLGSYNFRLTEDTSPGFVPPPPYNEWPFNVDMFGVERGAGGQPWSLGAFQFNQ